MVVHVFNPSTGGQMQTDFWVRGQPGLQSELQGSQGYTEKPCLEKTKKKKSLFFFFWVVLHAGYNEVYLRIDVLIGI